MNRDKILNYIHVTFSICSIFSVFILYVLFADSMSVTSYWTFMGLDVVQKMSSTLTPAWETGSAAISSSISTTQLSKTTYMSVSSLCCDAETKQHISCPLVSSLCFQAGSFMQFFSQCWTHSKVKVTALGIRWEKKGKTWFVFIVCIFLLHYQ